MSTSKYQLSMQRDLKLSGIVQVPLSTRKTSSTYCLPWLNYIAQRFPRRKLLSKLLTTLSILSPRGRLERPFTKSFTLTRSRKARATELHGTHESVSIVRRMRRLTNSGASSAMIMLRMRKSASFFLYLLPFEYVRKESVSDGVNLRRYIKEVKKATSVKKMSPSMQVWTMYYEFPPPVSPRIFTVVQVAHLEQREGSPRQG